MDRITVFPARNVILPGFIDPHTHFAMSSGYLEMLYVGPIESPGSGGMNPALLTHEAVLARLRELIGPVGAPCSSG